MASGYALPPPQPLEIHDQNAAEKWKKFQLAWSSYSLATELNKKSEKIQVATLLTVIGEEARDVFSTFNDWTDEGDSEKIQQVLEKFGEYCEPRKNIPFERYKFHRRNQEPGESYDQYRTALRKLAESCEFDKINPEEILRDKLVFGISDTKVRERLLRENKLSLAKTDEICRASESMLAQMKLVGNQGTDRTGSINAVDKSKALKNKNAFKQRRKTTHVTKECGNCGRVHDVTRKEQCPAYLKECRKCGKLSHFSAKCRSNKKQIAPKIRAVDDESDGEVFSVSTRQLDDSQLVTLKLASGNYLRFQPDTGSQCNVIPVHLYKLATKDVNLERVTRNKSHLSAYGGSKLDVIGDVRIRVWRDELKCSLDCKIVDSKAVRPLLGHKACVGMKIIKYHDNDEINKPLTGSAQVYSIESKPKQTAPRGSLTKEALFKKYPEVFGEGVGKLPGEHHIRMDPTVEPVQHAPRRVPVAIRAKLKEALEELEEQNIVTPVTTPTPWISSLVTVQKKSGKLRICLDPRDLNKAIQRENYLLPTIEDIATRLHGAKVFTKLDVRNGFWHIALDEKSSYLTTFHTPFGRYRWNRVPFGICSAPEVFQRKMHELVEGLSGIEVVADDFIVIGSGDTTEEAIKDHDKVLMSFLDRCKERGVKINTEKLDLRQKEVPFIGHVATDKGLRVDPTKVRAITEMPAPTDRAGVQRLLGLAQYLSKFLPHLSDRTKPLRELTQSDAEWVWDTPQANAFEELKKAVSSTPVLRYYNLQEEVTLQCDASQFGLGAAIMQGGQPLAFASRALTGAESRYAQIEKELLSIVFAAERFEPYVYGRDKVRVETDHKPLEFIFKKPLNSAPKRLQRMLLRLQKYNLQVVYKKGKEMFLADTLSRAYLPEVNVCDHDHDLEAIDHKDNLAVSAERCQQISHASADDPVLQQLRATIRRGWPETKSDLPECLYPYFDYRDTLTVQEELVFKAQQLIVPACLRKEMMAVCHSTHIGVEGCIRRARDTLFWPRMATELREYVAKCDVCMAHRAAQTKEPILQHEVIARPWAKVGADLCEVDNRTLLVVCDYYSNYIEVARLSSTTSRNVIKELKNMFSRYGIPDIVVTDNGPQFSSAEFAVFAKTWMFDHTTSSPHHPQSNGKAENAVKTVKRLFTKCKESGQSEFLALLDWRNTPTEGIGTSPAQRLLGRRCKTLLPVTGTLLQPRYSTEEDTRALMGQKRRQQYYYNRHSRPLQPLNPKETVRMKLPGQKSWSPGTVMGQVGPRSYDVEVGKTVYRRNRRHLINAGEPPIVNSSNHPEPDPVPPPLTVPEPKPAEPQIKHTPVEEDSPRRCQRHRQPPTKLKDYVTK